MSKNKEVRKIIKPIWFNWLIDPSQFQVLGWQPWLSCFFSELFCVLWANYFTSLRNGFQLLSNNGQLSQLLLDHKYNLYAQSQLSFMKHPSLGLYHTLSRLKKWLILISRFFFLSLGDFIKDDRLPFGWFMSYKISM